MEPVTRTCPSGKACFQDEQAAMKHEFVNRSQYGNQRAYKCEDCRFWHLTSKVESSRPYALSSIYQVGEPGGAEDTSKSYVDKYPEVVKLYKSGVKMAEIGRRTGVPYTAVNSYLVRNKIHIPTAGSQPIEKIKSVDVLEEQENLVQKQMEAQIAEMQARLAAIQARKAEVIEQSQWKIFPGKVMVGDEETGIDTKVVVIQLFGDFLRFSPDDGRKLVTKLKDYLDESPA
jgi:hypothetical protein